MAKLQSLNRFVIVIDFGGDLKKSSEPSCPFVLSDVVPESLRRCVDLHHKILFDNFRKKIRKNIFKQSNDYRLPSVLGKFSFHIL